MNKWIKRTLIAAASIIVLLVATLAIHIYMVSGSKAEYNGLSWQLAKIDFKQPLDSIQQIEAKKALWKIDGIKQVVINKTATNVVFAYDLGGDLSHQKVYQEFMDNGDFEATLFRPSKDQMTNGCPVIDKNSISYRLGSYFENLFASN